MAHGDYELFMLRVWAERRELSGRPSVYRGRIEHVRSEQSTYFAELAQIVPFLRACLEDLGALPPGGFIDDLED